MNISVHFVHLSHACSFCYFIYVFVYLEKSYDWVRDIKCCTLWGGLKWQKSHHYLVHFLKQHFWALALLGQYYHCTISEDIFLAQCQADYRLLKIVKRVPHNSIEYCAFIRIKVFWFWFFSIAHVPTMKYRCYSLDILRIKYKTHAFVGIQCLEQLVVLHNQYVFKYAHISWNNMWENKMFAICSNISSSSQCWSVGVTKSLKKKIIIKKSILILSMRGLFLNGGVM